MQQYQVTGMSCAACQARVEKAVAQVPGVTSVAVSLLTNSMGVEGTADSRAVIAAVEKAGYGASLKAGYDASLNTPEKERSSASSQEDALKDRETPRLLRRLALSAGFLLVLMYITMGHHMLGLPLPPYFDHNYLGLALTQMLLALIVMFINRKFFESGTRSLLHGAPNMDTLVALGSGVSFAWSLFVFFTMCGNITNGTPNSELHELYHNQLYFESAAMIPTLITVGKALESRSKGRTTDALRSLMKLAPKTARVLRPSSCAEGESSPAEVTVPIEEVRVEDIFAVKPGESIPVDGIVVEGESAVDESALTGESIPVDKTTGDKVSAATINHSGYLLCRATRVGEDTTLSQIIRMVSDAAATKAPIARIADKVSGIFVPAVIGIAILVTAAWLVAGKEVSFALARGICVLVISCPCALGLATPVAIMVGNGLGARNGVLFKTSEAIEETGKATIVALDKTGTITTGQPRVMGIYETRGTDKNDLLRKAYLLEKKSEHPLARAIVEEYERAAGQMRSEDLSGNDTEVTGNDTEVTGSDEAKMTGSENSEVTAFTIHAGHGLEGRIGGKLLHAGSGKYIRQFTDVTSEMQETETTCAEDGQTPLFFEEDGKLLGIISVADSIRDDSEIGIRNLKNLGLTVVMLTGDNPRTADAIAQKAGVDYVVSGILPDGKADAVKELQKNGKVIMVGDGINDAPAMATADIGIAIGAGTDVAIDSADVVLMNSALTDVAAAVRLSRKTLKNIHENLFWAFFYNVICIPVAAGVLSWKMNPMIGAAAMSLSSFTVCMNALRLNLFKMRDASHDVVLNGRKPAALPLPKPGATSEATVKTPQAASERIVVPETEKGSAKMKKVLIIEGMMCGHCEASVKKALEALPYIASAAPDHTSNTCVVDITDDGAWDEGAVKAIIEGKDYKYLGTKD